MINGSVPVVGKQVYDMNLGYGKIISVEPDMAFVVDFGGTVGSVSPPEALSAISDVSTGRTR